MNRTIFQTIFRFVLTAHSYIHGVKSSNEDRQNLYLSQSDAKVRSLLWNWEQ